MDVYTSKTIKLKANNRCLYLLSENVESDKLLYSINYQLSDEGKIFYAELKGANVSKLIRICLDTQNGTKNGEFKTDTLHSNIFFSVENIRFFSDNDLEFHLTLFKK